MNVNTHVCGPTLVLASSSTGLMPVLRRELGPLRGVRMAFIPTASTVESYGVLVRLMRIRFALAGLRVQMVDPERMPAAQVCARLQSSDIIYVGGGNTFHLMHHLHAADADDVIRKLVREGVPYVGESAGAVVASDDISYIAPMDENRGAYAYAGARPHALPCHSARRLGVDGLQRTSDRRHACRAAGLCPAVQWSGIGRSRSCGSNCLDAFGRAISPTTQCMP